MRTGKLLYIPEGKYLTYRGITTISMVCINIILTELTSNKDIEKYSCLVKSLGLPIRSSFLYSEFEVIEDD